MLLLCYRFIYFHLWKFFVYKYCVKCLLLNGHSSPRSFECNCFRIDLKCSRTTLIWAKIGLMNIKHVNKTFVKDKFRKWSYTFRHKVLVKLWDGLQEPSGSSSALYLASLIKRRHYDVTICGYCPLLLPVKVITPLDCIGKKRVVAPSFSVVLFIFDFVNTVYIG